MPNANNIDPVCFFSLLSVNSKRHVLTNMIFHIFFFSSKYALYFFVYTRRPNEKSLSYVTEAQKSLYKYCVNERTFSFWIVLSRDPLLSNREKEIESGKTHKKNKQHWKRNTLMLWVLTAPEKAHITRKLHETRIYSVNDRNGCVCMCVICTEIGNGSV